MRELGEKKRDAQEQLVRLERNQRGIDAARLRMRDAERWCRSMAQGEGELTFEQKRTVLYGFNVRVIIHGSDVEDRIEIRIGSSEIDEDSDDAIVALSAS